MNELKSKLVERAFKKAKALNSAAKTLKGARAAIRKAGTKPLPGLQALTRRPGKVTVGRTENPDWSAKHECRIRQRCQFHLDSLQKAEHPHDIAREMASHWTVDAREALLATADAVVIARVLARLRWPYRRAESRWAGGKHSTKIRVGALPDAECDSVRAWSTNGKWTGNNSEAVLTVSRRCLELLGPGIVIDGLVTLDADLLEPGTYKAAWAEQSVGFTLKVVNGWIVDGYHSTAPTIEKARRQAAAARVRPASATGDALMV